MPRQTAQVGNFLNSSSIAENDFLPVAIRLEQIMFHGSLSHRVPGRPDS
jgi:hypothetical protein